MSRSARLAGGGQVAHAAALSATGLRRQVDDEVVWAATDVARLDAADVRGPIPVYRGVLTALVTRETDFGKEGLLHDDLRVDVWAILARRPAFGYSSGMKTATISLDETRHRLLEGVLLRLARLPQAGGLVLRGGMLLRHWFRPLARPALRPRSRGDVPRSPSRRRSNSSARCSLNEAIGDGVALRRRAVRSRGESGWTPATPACASSPRGHAGGDELDFHVDVTVGPIAAARRRSSANCRRRAARPARVWMCRPESIVGQKMQALGHLGMLSLAAEGSRRPASVARSRADGRRRRWATRLSRCSPIWAEAATTSRSLFGSSSWWGMKLSSARWLDFANSSRGRNAPRDLADVVAEVAGRPAAHPGGVSMSGGLEGSFLADIVANIDDDTPRLVYADWLMENGHDDRAEFIRVQIERARLPAWDGAQVALRLREQALLAQHGETWLAEMPKVEGAKWEGFRRGIVAEVSFASFEAMRTNAAACRAVAPVEAVTVRWPRRREGKNAAAPIAELRELSLTGRPEHDEIVRLADSPQLATLRVLNALGLAVEDRNAF